MGRWETLSEEAHAGCEGNLEEVVDSFQLSIGLEMKGGRLDMWEI